MEIGTAGGRASGPARGDAVDLLLECHQRIRRFLATARRLAEARGAPAGEVAEAARAVHRYFAEALPLHAEDEERSLWPRLSGRDAGLDAALAAMAAEHREHQAPLRRLLEACAALGAAPQRHAAEAPSLLDAVAELERHFEHHLAGEEAVIFPAVRRLEPSVDAAIVGEIRARRAAGRPGGA